jgi:hypothetical protein
MANNMKLYDILLPIIKVSTWLEYDIPKEIGITWGLSSNKIKIIRVLKNSIGEFGKFVVGDEIIAEVNGEEFESFIDLYYLIKRKKDSNIELIVNSKGTIVNKYLYLGNKAIKKTGDKPLRKSDSGVDGIIKKIDSASRLINIDIGSKFIEVKTANKNDLLPDEGQSVKIMKMNDPWTYKIYFFKNGELINIEAFEIRL